MSERLEGFALGGLTFIAASYILHCGFNMGPWRCQRSDCRHMANTRKRTTEKRRVR